MKKTFTQRLFIYMLAALLLTIVALFVLQTVVSSSNNTASSLDKLEEVKERLAGNEENIAQLTANLGENSLAKSRAFADMLAADKTIYGNAEKLEEIKERLMVNELHIIDEDGIITSSTIERYIGFDMKSGEQSNAFMVIVDDPSIEIVQEPQVNVAEGIMMQLSAWPGRMQRDWYRSASVRRFWRVCWQGRKSRWSCGTLTLATMAISMPSTPRAA